MADGIILKEKLGAILTQMLTAAEQGMALEWRSSMDQPGHVCRPTGLGPTSRLSTAAASNAATAVAGFWKAAVAGLRQTGRACEGTASCALKCVFL